MRISTFRESWANLAKENGILRFLILILIVAFLLEGYFITKLVGKTTVNVYVPEHLKEDFTIKNGTGDGKYFEQWALSLVPYVSSFTPQSVDFNLRVFLSHVHPKSYGAVETELLKLKEKVKKVQISQAFFPLQVSAFDNRISIDGRQVRFVGKTTTSDELIRDEFTFEKDNGEKPLIENINVTKYGGEISANK